MFRTSQIISRTQLLTNFKTISKHLYEHPQAILITQRKGVHLVLVNADIFEDLLEGQLKKDGAEIQNTYLKEQLETA